MIKTIKGDIFKQDGILVNPVNCVGVMGKGLAYAFKMRYPNMFIYYKTLCDTKKLKIGEPVLYKDIDKDILLFPTKDDWRNPSNYEWIQKGLDYIKKEFIDNETTYKTLLKRGERQIVFPLLGCGCGGLKDTIVIQMIKDTFKKIENEINIIICI